MDVILTDGDLKGVVVIGSSAGGIEALRRFMSVLPADLPVAVCVVLHIPATSRSLLAEIIARSTDAPASAAIHDEQPEPGHIYVAPPDRHLIVRRGRLELDPGPKENGVRPAVDPLFRSAATAYGANSAAVVLSGALSDGANGAAAVAAVGGLVLVQDPADAIVPSMPEAALRAVPGAVTADAPALAAAVAEFSRALGEPEEDQIVLDDVHQSPVERSRHRPEGPPSGFTCPECHGPLLEFSGREPIRYRCPVGHVYYEDHLVAEKSTEIEAALWAGLKALEERAELLDRVARRMQSAGRHERARSCRERVASAQQRAEVLRDALLDDEDASEAVA